MGREGGTQGSGKALACPGDGRVEHRYSRHGFSWSRAVGGIARGQVLSSPGARHARELPRPKPTLLGYGLGGPWILYPDVWMEEVQRVVASMLSPHHSVDSVLGK